MSLQILPSSVLPPEFQSRSALQFDADSHTYKLGGRVVPSVTQVLAMLRGDLSRINQDTLRAAGERGTAVHAAIELDVDGQLDEESCSTHTLACLAQWRRFKADSGLRVIACEKRVYHQQNGYAGTADIFGRDPIAKGATYRAIDVKTCAPHWTHALQLAAYVEAERSMPGVAGNPWIRSCLYLSPDGYRLVTYSDHDDFRAWNHALALFYYRSNYV